MSAKEFTIFDLATRLPVTCVTGPDEAIEARVKKGQVAIEGRHRGAVRLNEAGEVERDEIAASALVQERLVSARKGQIEELERKQARIIRELTIDPTVVGEDGKTPPERLRALDQEIAAVRSADRQR